MLRPYRTPCAASRTPSTGPACGTRSCGATPSRTDAWSPRATAPARTCSCGASPTSPSNTSSTSTNLHQPPPTSYEQPPPVRPPRDRRVLPGVARDRLLGRAARKERERRLLPGQPGCRLVRGGGEPVRVEHRERASGRPRGHRGGERARGGPLRVARLPHPAAPGLVVHAVLSAQRRIHHARVSRAPLQPGRTHVLHVGLGDRLCTQEH